MLRVVAIFLIGLIVGVGVTFAYRGLAPTAPTTPAGDNPTHSGNSSTTGQAAQIRRSVVALGTLEPRYGVVLVGSALVGYPIREVRVKEGQYVQAGDVLIEIDNSAPLAEQQLALAQQSEALERQQTEIALAKERVAAARLALEQVQSGKQLEIDTQQARIKVAAAKLAQAKKDVERLEGLRKLAEPLASEQQVEQQHVVVEAASAEHDAAEVGGKRLAQSLVFQEQTAAAELRAAELSLAIAEKGTGVEAVKRRVELATLKLKQTSIVAPSAGVVLGVVAHPGEMVAQQPLVQIANLDELVCVAEVEAGDVPLLSANNAAVITCRAFQDAALDGAIDQVGNQIVQAALRPLDPRKPVDRNVTKVTVNTDARKAARLFNVAGKERRGALIGLQVEVEFPLAK